MKSVDTNVLARFILADDPAQHALAAETLRAPFWVSESVWLELGWVLHSRLKLDRAMVADMLDVLLALDTVHGPGLEAMPWVIARYRAGADWADAMHLISSAGMADAFITFDRGIGARIADPPLSVECPA